METEDLNSLSKYLKALLAIQLRDSSNGDEQGKPEIILSSVGLPNKEIAEILGKSVDAVAKAIQRAGKKAPKRGK